jgi:hypothetical protein
MGGILEPRARPYLLTMFTREAAGIELWGVSPSHLITPLNVRRAATLALSSRMTRRRKSAAIGARSKALAA